jgi:2-polyprenyl-3-methyl-5-hydroxy-6-metoxy-1,4-benzoquinol methylase
MDPQLKEMLRINESQRKYYEEADGASESEINSLATNLWRRWRAKALSVFNEAEIDRSLSDMHLKWVGSDLSTSKVLDLGVGYGNPLSMTFARNAKEYLAIDLSAPLVERFRKQLERAGTSRARACVADILSADFAERNFDVVYARAVFHHFKHFDAFLGRLHRCMSPGGIAVTLDDPLETWLPMKLLRLVYRPFQTDASWEYPFTGASLKAIQRYFTIEQVQGTYGFSKWAIPLGFIAPDFARRRALGWHLRDMNHPYDLNNVTSCLRVSLLLRRKEVPA